jgi:hypothetical protein
MPFQPALCAPFVRQAVLVLVAPDDEMPHCHPAAARAAFDALPGVKHRHERIGISNGLSGL